MALELKNTYSIRLLTPESPRASTAPKEIQQELQGVYQAIRNLASLVDIYSGQYVSPPGEEVDPSEDMRTKFIVERFSYIYLPMIQSVTYGQLIAINSAGYGMLPPAGGGGNQEINHPIGYLAEEACAAGEFAKVSVRGLIRSSGLTPGMWLTWDFFTGSGGFVNPVGYSGTTATIARVIHPNYIYFTGVTENHLT